MTKVSAVFGVRDGKAECVICSEDAQVVKDRYLELRDKENGGDFDSIQLIRKPVPDSRASFDRSPAAPKPKKSSKK